VLGIVDCGRIGQVVASSATAMGMQIIGYHPIISSAKNQPASRKLTSS
jgi:phosphoglycerate dehydrogenase-like enzyme